MLIYTVLLVETDIASHEKSIVYVGSDLVQAKAYRVYSNKEAIELILQTWEDSILVESKSISITGFTS